jgi:uncharacterized small protein (DUF1192 family)
MFRFYHFYCSQADKALQGNGELASRLAILSEDIRALTAELRRRQR